MPASPRTRLATAKIHETPPVVDWEQPTREAMLWAADCVAGAVTQWAGDQPAHFDVLRHRLDLVEVAAR